MIFEKSHLPYIFSEDNIKKNGAPVYQTINRLVMNTEEIYLYLFKMDEKLKKLENENKNLKEKIEQLIQMIN